MKGVPINIDELSQETKDRLGVVIAPSVEEISRRHIALGKILMALKGLTDNDALWALQQTRRYLARAGEVISEPNGELGEGDYVPSIYWVLQVIARNFKLSPNDLKHRNRSKNVVNARQVAMYLLWATDKYTLSEIGQALGGRSPATISHGFQQVARQLDRGGELVQRIEEIKLEL